MALPLISSACGGGSSHTNALPLASRVEQYCGQARNLRTRGADLYIALRKTAPTEQVRSDIESVLALNDANFVHYFRVENYTLKACGIDLPHYGG